jgi:hypothetical protein
VQSVVFRLPLNLLVVMGTRLTDRSAAEIALQILLLPTTQHRMHVDSGNIKSSHVIMPPQSSYHNPHHSFSTIPLHLRSANSKETLQFVFGVLVAMHAVAFVLQVRVAVVFLHACVISAC